jgi:hypothetical protein
MHTSAHTILWDPDGLIEAELPLDRVLYECLVKAVLAWTGPGMLPERDYEQIGLQLTGTPARSPRAYGAAPSSCRRTAGAGRSPTSSCARRKCGCP